MAAIFFKCERVSGLSSSAVVRNMENADSPDKLLGPGELRATLCEVVANLSIRGFPGLRAVVLTGSAAREESTIVRNGEPWEVLGDAEFLLVFQGRTTLPQSSGMMAFCAEVEKALFLRGIRCSVSASAVHPEYFSKMRPHIFGYELRVCGQVVWGDSKILSLIPAFGSSDIPLEDGWRLLSNRMVELLEVAGQWPAQSGSLSWELYYRTIKLYLDMATSYLVFVGRYAPTYALRDRNLEDLAAGTTESESPFLLQGFARRVDVCTRLKIQLHSKNSSEYESLIAASPTWEECVSDAAKLWRWELLRLTRGEPDLPTDKLMKRWMQIQPFSAKLRGWASVLRRSGWQRSWPDWPRWLPLAWAGSPRYWVYYVASELLFRAAGVGPSALDQEPPRSEMGKLAACLPVLKDKRFQAGVPWWRWLASETAWNYHRFLEPSMA